MWEDLASVSETYDSPSGRLPGCIREKEVRLEAEEDYWGCFSAQCTPAGKQYKHDTPTGWGNSSCMVTNQTWNVYVVCVWEGVWVCMPEKNKGQGWLWSACGASHRFIYSCITVRQGGPSPDQRYGYWTGQDINISLAPFLPSSFSHPLPPFFWHGAGVPQSCSTLTLCSGKCHKLKTQPYSKKEQSEAQRGISEIENVQPSCDGSASGSLL